MKRVVLANARGGIVSKQYIPPLGLGYLAASVQAQGYEPFILDAYALRLSTEESVQRIAELKPDAIGITATTHNRSEAIELANTIKKELGLLLLGARTLP